MYFISLPQVSKGKQCYGQDMIRQIQVLMGLKLTKIKVFLHFFSFIRFLQQSFNEQLRSCFFQIQHQNQILQEFIVQLEEFIALRLESPWLQ